MNSQIIQVHRWMEENARTVRYQPATGVPSVERFTQVERLLEQTHELIHHLGMNVGRMPTIVNTGENISPSSVLLARLTHLLAEVLATYHMLGLSPTLSRAMAEFTSRKPLADQPNWRVIVDETFPDMEGFE